MGACTSIESTRIEPCTREIQKFKQALPRARRNSRGENAAQCLEGSAAELSLVNCSLSSVPKLVWTMVSLEGLILTGNQNLKSIPGDIGALTRLNKLDCENCSALGPLPMSAFSLPLTSLNLGNVGLHQWVSCAWR
jgi:hypothetical protein